jgi:dTDP-4-dehydrorhamnose reductase
LKILVTGASGYLGSRVYSDLKKTRKFESVVGTFGSRSVFPELVKMDVTSEEETLEVVEKVKPNAIVHFAANPSSLWCKEHPVEAKKLNEEGARNVVSAANEVDARVVYSSTLGALNPVNFYHETKKNAESEVRKARAGFVNLRLGAVIGLSPSLESARFMSQFVNGLREKKLPEFDSARRFPFTWTGTISKVCERILENDFSGELALASQELSCFSQVAQDLLSASGITGIEANFPKTQGVDESRKALTSLEVQAILDDEKKLKELGFAGIVHYKEIIEETAREVRELLLLPPPRY